MATRRNFSLKRAYLIAVIAAGVCCVLCPMLERSYELETVAEADALISLSISAVAICFAAVLLRRGTVVELRQAALITLLIPIASGFIELLFKVQVNVHGVGMTAFFFGGLLSLLAVLILSIGAMVKHIRAIN